MPQGGEGSDRIRRETSAIKAAPVAGILWDRLPLIFAVTNLLLLGWMLAGIRHANHDDLYFEIVAHNPDLPWTQVAIWAAELQQRTTHLFNVPIALVGVWIGSTWIGEWVYQAQLLAMGLLAFLTLRRLTDEAVAAGWLALTCGAFAIHYYFMAPPGYPLIGLFSPSLFLLSLYLLLRHIERPSPLCLAGSLLASLIAVGWPEYDFIIFTLPVAGILVWKTSGTRRRRLLGLYGGVWLIGIVFYASGKLLFPAGSDAARVTPSFDLVALAKTFLTLWPKAILPFGLVEGIRLAQQAVPGVPALPALITFHTVARLLFSDPAFLAVLLAWGGGFWLVLRKVCAPQGALWALLAAGIMFLLAPTAVLSLSATYQHTVLAGYIQGHLSSGVAQVGFATVVFSASALLASRWRSSLVCAPLALLMAAICVLSLGYNLLMRDALAANNQRWAAFHLAAQAIPAGSKVVAPTFWGNNGVSAVPATLPFGMANYWTSWAQLMEGRPLDVRRPDETPQDGYVHIAYAPSPSGAPLVLIQDSSGLMLLSQVPRNLGDWRASNWECGAYCRLNLPATTWEEAEKLLRTTEAGANGLLSRLLLNRDGAFGGLR
ncbi:hypothetical protein GCM10007301_18310 [Azorhizobium oxalatiphilum]|uniref:Uncharacterized protein n=2 Tax=Azorhizobium oxalatiphilum TaxID=980631 RepID=A0A917BVG2_9HYPH|nr:hypothetical protein GCM10007301_18310 [Azorhizobium oxalatiphilum]